jgi:hypothetical protein
MATSSFFLSLRSQPLQKRTLAFTLALLMRAARRVSRPHRADIQDFVHSESGIIPLNDKQQMAKT